MHAHRARTIADLGGTADPSPFERDWREIPSTWQDAELGRAWRLALRARAEVRRHVNLSTVNFAPPPVERRGPVLVGHR